MKETKHIFRYGRLIFLTHAIVDLFCGIGGLTHGLQLAGLNVVAGIDIESSCKYAYERNNTSQFVHSDITEITSQELDDLFGNDVDTKILVGCAPCQPFSKYTKRYRKDGQRDTKWKLLYSFSNLVRNIQPQIVSMENVPELAKETVFNDFVEQLLALNYSVSYQIAYCPDYGVPQHRKRLVLLASTLGDIDLVEPMFTPNNYRTVQQAIGNLPAISDGEICAEDTMHRSSVLSDLNKQRIQQSIPGGTWRDWDEELQLVCHKKSTGRTYSSVYGRMVWNEPSPTITTQFYGLGNGRFGHPEQNRALSLREGAILQSFPPDYEFEEEGNAITIKKLGIHIGNAVPVELGRAIGLSICNHLREVGLDG